MTYAPDFFFVDRVTVCELNGMECEVRGECHEWVNANMCVELDNDILAKICDDNDLW